MKRRHLYLSLTVEQSACYFIVTNVYANLHHVRVINDHKRKQHRTLNQILPTDDIINVWRPVKRIKILIEFLQISS